MGHQKGEGYVTKPISCAVLRRGGKAHGAAVRLHDVCGERNTVPRLCPARYGAGMNSQDM